MQARCRYSPSCATWQCPKSLTVLSARRECAKSSRSRKYRVWSAGFAYDSSPVSRANRVAVLPADRQLRYGTGIQYQINHDVAAGFAWTAMDAGPGPFSNNRGPLAGVLQGHFSTNWLNFVVLNIIWKF